MCPFPSGRPLGWPSRFPAEHDTCCLQPPFPWRDTRGVRGGVRLRSFEPSGQSHRRSAVEARELPAGFYPTAVVAAVGCSAPIGNPRPRRIVSEQRKQGAGEMKMLVVKPNPRRMRYMRDSPSENSVRGSRVVDRLRWERVFLAAGNCWCHRLGIDRGGRALLAERHANKKLAHPQLPLFGCGRTGFPKKLG
jgi:hypothetical protein